MADNKNHWVEFGVIRKIVKTKYKTVENGEQAACGG